MTVYSSLIFKVDLMIIVGADFIKTSTGKEGVNAILPVALVMVRAIREYFYRTGHKVRISCLSVRKRKL